MEAKMNMPTGLEDLFVAIAQSEADVDLAAHEALSAAGDVIIAGMKRRVPVRKDTRKVKGGTLKNSLDKSKVEQDGNVSTLKCGLIHEKAYTGAEVARYGNVMEYGSSSVKAQPYVRPTMLEDKKQIMAVMVKSLKEKGFAE